MNLATFRVLYPELNTAPDPIVSGFLASAARSIDADLYGDRFDDAHGCLTAHLVCLSPYGKNARLDSKKATTTYGVRYEEIRFEVTPSILVP